MYTLILVALAATALARPSVQARAPADEKEMTVEQASNQCGDDQVMSCCYTFQGDSGGLLGGNQLNLLGGQCSPIPISSLLIPITKACSGQQAACCSGNQTGLINVQCVPIAL